MIVLVLAAIVWIGLHVGVAGTTVRARLVALIGEGGFRGAFSLASVLAISALSASYVAGPTIPLWYSSNSLRWVLVALMLVASLLFVASVGPRNATAIGGEAALSAEPRGIARITRHPMLWAFALWGLVHVIGNGDLASIVFFGAFLITALIGMPSIDAKIAARDPAAWAGFARTTSVVPGAAILGGRNRLALAEIGWPIWVGGVALWLVLLFGHRHVIGIAPVSGL